MMVRHLDHHTKSSSKQQRRRISGKNHNSDSFGNSFARRSAGDFANCIRLERAFKKLQDTLQKNTGYQELKLVSKELQGENVENELKVKPTKNSTFKYSR